MPDARWSLHEARNRFSAIIEAAEHGHPQIVTKRGKPAAVILSMAEYQRFQHPERTETHSFANHLLAIPQDDGDFDGVLLTPRDISF